MGSRTRIAALVMAALAAACSSKSSNDHGAAKGSGSAGSAVDRGSAVQPSPYVHPGSADDEEATAVEPDSGHGTAPPKKVVVGEMKATVSLALSGAVVTSIKGSGGRCVCHDDTASFTIRSEDHEKQVPFALTILVTKAEEWTNPAIMLDVSAPRRGTYGRNANRHRAEDKLSIAKDCSSVKLDDVLLRGIAGSKGEITLKGSIACTP